MAFLETNLYQNIFKLTLLVNTISHFNSTGNLANLKNGVKWIVISFPTSHLHLVSGRFSSLLGANYFRFIQFPTLYKF